MTTEIDAQAEEWFNGEARAARRRGLALGAAVVVGALTGVALYRGLAPAPPAPHVATRPAARAVLRPDPLYITAPREPAPTLSASARDTLPR